MNHKITRTGAERPTESGTAILNRLDGYSRQLKEYRCNERLQYEGVDTLEALKLHLYPVLLSQCRAQGSTGSQQIDFRLFKHGLLSYFREILFLSGRLWDRVGARVFSSDIGPKKVLFWPCEPTHVNAQMPVSRALTALGIENGFITSRPWIHNYLSRAGYDVLFLDKHFGKEIDRGKNNWEKRRAGFDFEYQETDEFGPPPWDPEQAMGAMKKRMVQLMPLVFQTVDIFQGILAQMSPSVLVVGNDISYEGRTACLAARNYGLPTVSLMHGAISGNPVHACHIADRFLVYGESSKKTLAQLDDNPSRFVACGAPYLDKRPRQTGKINSVLCKRIQLHSKQPYVLVATSGPGVSVSYFHHLLVIKNLMRLSMKYKEINFIAKLHRKDRLEYYEKCFEEVPGSRLKVIEYGAKGYPVDIFHWLQGCSCLITGASSVAMEAMLMDVPVITLDFCEEFECVDFIDKDTTIHVSEPTELDRYFEHPDAIANAFSKRKPNIDAYLKASFFDLDGKSSLRCAKEICDLI